MKMAYRLLAVLVAALLTLTVLAGCTTTATPTPAPATDQPTGAATPESKLLVGTPITYKLMKGMHQMQPMTKDAEVFKWITENLGVTIDYEGFVDGWDEKLNLMLSSNAHPDIVDSGASIARDYGPLGAFLEIPVDTLPNMKAAMEMAGTDALKVAADGKYYHFPCVKRYEIVEADIPMIRYDLVEAAGKELPTSFTELYDTLLAIKEGNPTVTKTWYARSNEIWNFVAYSFGGGFGMYYDKDVNGGSWQYGQAHPETFKPALEWLTSVYQAGILDPDYEAGSSSGLWEAMQTGNSAFYWDGLGFASNMNIELQKTNPDALVAPLPTCLEGGAYVRGYKNRLHYVNNGFSLNANIASPETAFALFDWMYSEEGADVTNFGIEGTDWTRNADGNPEVIPAIADQYRTAADPWRAYMGYIGAGQLGFGVYWDESQKLPFMNEVDKNAVSIGASNTALSATIKAIKPTFTEEQNQQRSDLMAPIDTMSEEVIGQIISGTLPITAYDQLVTDITALNYQEVENIYNTAEAQYK